MAKKIRVYVSSTYEDLKEYRAAVIQELNLLDLPDFHVQPIAMEGYHASDERPIDRCVKDVETNDIYVGLYGFRYGWISSDTAINPDRLSVTELEYRQAIRCGKPRLLFLADKTQNDLKACAFDETGEQQDKLKKLRIDVGRERLVDSFNDPKECALKVKDAVTRHLEKSGTGAIEPPPHPLPKPIRIGGTLPFHFIGKRFKDRQATLALLMEKIKDPGVRVVVIEGRAGQGKSAIAARLCEQIHAAPQRGGNRLADPTQLALEMGITGVAYFSFREDTGALQQKKEIREKLSFNREEFITAFSHALPHTEFPLFSAWRQTNATCSDALLYRQMLHHANDGHILVVLDNFEDALTDRETLASPSLSDFFTELLRGAVAVTVLVTTRRSVSMALPTLAAVVSFPELDRLPEDDCVALLRELDGPDGLNGRAKLAEAPESVLRSIAKLAEGNPRALELTARVLQRDLMKTPQNLVTDLKAFQGKVLDELLRDAWGHVFEWEREAASALAILGRPATAAEVAALLKDRAGIDAEMCLNSLCDTYLAFAQTESQTYLLHEKDRSFLLEGIDQEDARLKHRNAAALAAARKCSPDDLRIESQLAPWSEEFEHLLAANHLRAAWKAIEPITPEVLWEKNLARITFDWFTALLADADDTLRGDLLGPYGSLLFYYSRDSELVSIAREDRQRAVREKHASGESRALAFEATALQGLGQFAEAEPLSRRSLEIDEKSCGPNHLKVAIGLNNLANILAQTNRLTEAEPIYRRSLQIDEMSYDPEHPEVAIGLSCFALLLQETNRLAEAELLFRRSLAICEDSYGPDHPDFANKLSNLGRLLLLSGRGEEITESLEAAQRALVIDRASFEPGHWYIGVDLENLALALLARNGPEDLEEADTRVAEGIAILRTALGSAHWRVARGLRTAGKVAMARKKVDQAIESLREAAAILSAMNPIPLRDTAEAYGELAGALRESGDTAGADAAATQGAEFRARFDAQEERARAMIARDPSWPWRAEV